MDTAIMVDGYNYRYKSEIVFPVTNVFKSTMDQIAYLKYWAVLEAPTVCTNRDFHEYYTGTP